MRWTLGRIALALLLSALLLVMCGGYLGADGLLGLAVISGVLGCVALVARTLGR